LLIMLGRRHGEDDNKPKTAGDFNQSLDRVRDAECRAPVKRVRNSIGNSVLPAGGLMQLPPTFPALRTNEIGSLGFRNSSRTVPRPYWRLDVDLSDVVRNTPGRRRAEVGAPNAPQGKVMTCISRNVNFA
jgi:hypothetical protein